MSKSALRVLEIMEHIAQQPTGCTHTDIANGLQIPKSSLTALLKDMMHKGYLRREPASGVFTIGVQVLWLANSYLRNLSLARLGEPMVAAVFAKVHEFTLLAIPNRHEYVVICTESMPSIFAHTLQMGQRGPLFCSAVGRAVLAFMSDDQVDAILDQSDLRPVTPTTKTSVEDIKKELARTRRTGIGYSKNEGTAGVVGYAAPIFGANGSPIASLGVGLSSKQISPAKAKLIEAELHSASLELSMQLGWRGRALVA